MITTLEFCRSHNPKDASGSLSILDFVLSKGCVVVSLLLVLMGAVASAKIRPNQFYNRMLFRAYYGVFAPGNHFAFELTIHKFRLTYRDDGPVQHNKVPHWLYRNHDHSHRRLPAARHKGIVGGLMAAALVGSVYTVLLRTRR